MFVDLFVFLSSMSTRWLFAHVENPGRCLGESCPSDIYGFCSQTHLNSDAWRRSHVQHLLKHRFRPSPLEMLNVFTVVTKYFRFSVDFVLHYQTLQNADRAQKEKVILCVCLYILDMEGLNASLPVEQNFPLLTKEFQLLWTKSGTKIHAHSFCTSDVHYCKLHFNSSRVYLREGKFWLWNLKIFDQRK